jgi:hypothetical protein
MSTLPEIEAAADALPLEQKQELFMFLAARLEGKPRIGGTGAGEGTVLSSGGSEVKKTPC